MISICNQVGSLFVEPRLYKAFELWLIAVEHVDVNIACDAADLAIGAQLPVNQFYIGFVLSVAGYPDIVFLFDVLRMVHVMVDETLADVKDGTHACSLFHDIHEDPDALHQLFVTSDSAYLGIRRLHVKNGRKVAFAEQGVVDKVVGLSFGC